MAKVKIVYVPTPDRRGPDTDRIGTVEDIDDELARMMVSFGEAVYVDDDQAVTEPAQPTVVPEMPAGATVPTADDLAGLTKAELLDRVPDGVDVPAGATKADLVALITGDSTSE